jgi:hypothetical protein
MRKSTLILSLTTAAFATSTMYLALQLRSRGQAVSIGATTTAMGAKSADDAGRKITTPKAPGAERDSGLEPAAIRLLASSTSMPAAAAGGRLKGDAAADANVMFARQQLARLDDPMQRAALLNDTRTNMRRQYARLRDQLKLSDTTFEQLVGLMAERYLQAQEIYARCAADPACNSEDNFKRHPVDDHSQELLALLGADQVDALTKFHAVLAERDAVAQLRGRLTEINSMRDDRADILVAALADERNRYQTETAARGATSLGWGTNLGMIFYSADSNSSDQQFAEATQYSQRLRERARSVLTPAQFAAYNQMQDELLAQMATYMRPTSTAN